MADEVASLGLKVSTDGIQEANDELNELAQVAPKVEKALEAAEKSAAKTGKTLASLGQGAGRDLQTVGTGAGNAQEGIDRLGKSADVAEKALKRMAATSGQIGDLSGDFKSVSDSMARLNQQLAATITGMGEFGESFKKTSKNANDSATSITKFFAAAAAGVSVWSVIDMADDWGQMASRVQMATKSQDEYNLVMQRTAASAKTTYRDVNEVRELFILSASSIQALGYSLDQTLTLQESFSNLLVTNSASAERGASAIDALSSALISGAVSGEDWKRITTAMPTLIDRMSDATGKSAEQIKLLGKEGKIALSDFTKTLLETAAANKEAADAMPATVREAIRNASTGLKEFLGYNNQATGATQALVGGLNLLGNNMNVVATAGAAVAVVMGARLASSLALSTIEFTKNAASATVTSYSLLRSAAAGSTAATSFATLGTTMRAVNTALTPFGGAFGAILTAAGLVATAMYAFRDSNAAATQTLIAMGDPIDEVTKKLEGMEDAQRKVTTTKLLDQQITAVQGAQAAWENFAGVFLTHAMNAGMSEEAVNSLWKELEKAKTEGAALLPFVDRLAASGIVNEKGLSNLTTLAAQYQTVAKVAADAVAWMERLNSASSTPTAGAANDAANLTKRLLAEADAMAQGAAAYKSKAQATQDLLTKQAEYSAMLKNLEAEGKGATASANTLRDAIKGIGERMAGTAKSTGSATSAYANWISTIAEKTAAMRLELDGNNKLTDSQKLLIKLNTDLATGKLKVSAATAQKLKTDIQELAVLEKLNAETDRNVKAYLEWIKGQEEIADAYVQLSKSKEDLQRWTYEENKALKESGELLKLEEKLIGATDRQRRVAVATLQSEIQMRRELAEIDDNRDVDEPAREEARIEARKRHAERIAQAEGQIYINEWDKTAQTIGQTLQDYIMGGGKDAAQYLKRLFSTLILQPIVQMGTQNITEMISGLFSQGGGSGGSGGSGGGTSNGIMGGLSAFGPWAALIAMGMNMAGKAYDQGHRLSHREYAAAWMATGGIAPPTISFDTELLGGVLGDRLANIITGASLWAKYWNKIDGSGDPHVGATGFYTTSGGSENFASGVTKYDGGIGTMVEDLAGAVGTSLEAFMASFGLGQNVSVQTSWADDFDGEGGSWGSLIIRLQDSMGEWIDVVDWSTGQWDSKWSPREFSPMEEGWDEYVEAVMQGYVDALQTLDLPSWANDVLAGIADDASLEEINAQLALLGQMKGAFDDWTTYLVEFANVGDDAFGALLESMHGFENLSAGVASFVDLYYSDAEKLDMAQKQLQEELEKFDLKLPELDMSDVNMDSAEEVKAAWRAMVAEALAAGEEGAELAAMLLRLGPAFAQTTDAAEAAAQAEKERAQAQIDEQKRVIDELYSDAGISGDTIAKILRDGMLGRLTQEDVGAQLSGHIIDGIYNSIAGGFADQITGILTSQIITPVLQAAAAGSLASAVVSQAAIDTVLDSVSKALDAMEMLFSDAGFLALIDRIKGFSTSLNIGGPNAAPVRTPTYSGGGSVSSGSNRASELEGLMRQIYQLEENFTALRKMEIDALVASNRPFQERIYALQAQQQADQRIASMDAELLKLSGDTEAQRAQQLQDVAKSLAQYMLSAEQLNAVLDKQNELWAAQDAKAAQNEFDNLWKQWIQKTDEAAALELERAALMSDTSRALFDQIRAYDKLKSAITSATGTLQTEIDRLMDSITESAAGTAYYESQFAILTAQARAGDTEAAMKLPSIVQALEQAVTNGASSEYEIRNAQFGYMTSLEETQRILNEILSAAGVYQPDGGAVGESVTTPQVEVINTISDVVVPALTVTNNFGADLVAEVRRLNEKVDRLEEIAASTARHAARTAGVQTEWKDKNFLVEVQ